MPPAKAGVDSRAAQLVGFPRKFMVSLVYVYPAYEIASTVLNITQNKTGQNITKQNKTKQNRTM